MAIKTNLKSMVPRREAFKREIILLSKGAGNRTAWPEGKLIVYPWDSTVDNLLLSGARQGGPRNLLYEILEQVCDMQGHVDDFYADEVSLVLLVSRAQGNGGVMNYTSTCPNPVCANQAQEHIRVPDELEPVGAKDVAWPGYDEIVLPECKDCVRVRPLQIKDEKIILQRTPDQRAEVSDHILRILLHVDAISPDGKEWGKPGSLQELLIWYNALPPADSKALDEQERALSPHANTLIPHKCGVCGRQFTHMLAFDADFFR